MEQIPEQLSQKARKLFIIDGMGALFSSLMLGVIWVRWQECFGLPIHLLYVLALIPLGFVLYDLFAILNKHFSISRLLRGIAFLNICYVLLSFVLAIYHFDLITLWAKLYLSGEVIVVLIIVRWEIRFAQTLSDQGYPYLPFGKRG